MVDGSDLVFLPRLPFLSGQVYTACVARTDLDDFAERSGVSFVWPGHAVELTEPVMWLVMSMSAQPVGSAPTVTEVWPEEQLVPDNLLRLYVHFSEPMLERDVEQSVRLLDEQGIEIEDAFVAIPNGLWDPSSTRLTLFFHPGRIKRGVGPRERLGPVLESGRQYELVVGGDLSSRRGASLETEVRRRFEVGESDRRSPRSEAWRLASPDGPNGELTITFDEALDRAQLETAVVVQKELQPGVYEVVAGSVEVSKDARIWSLTPQTSWLPARYRVTVSSSVEDLAGNTPLRLFDVAISGIEAGSRPGSIRRSDEPQSAVEWFFEVSRREGGASDESEGQVE